MQRVWRWLKKAWHWLTSMRTALVLLFLLALVSIPGALLPQRTVSQFQVDEWIASNPRLGHIYDRLQLFDIFSSTWFIAIVTLLMVSLVGCILPRSWDHYKAYKTPPTRAPKFLHRMPMHAEGIVDKPLEEAKADATRALKRWHVAEYSAEEDRAGANSLAAERGYGRELANLIFHIGIVAVLITVFVGRMIYYEGQVIIVTESESEYAVPVEQSQEFCNTSPANFDSFRAGALFDGTGLTPFCFVSHNFVADYLPNGQAKEFTSDISYALDDEITTDQETWQNYTLRVNHPLRIGGDRVYLQGHGFAPQITVTWPNGESRTQMIQFQPDDPTFFLSSGVMRFDPPAGMYPDLFERRQNQIAIEGLFAPTAQWGGVDNNELTSVYPSMQDPAMAIDIYRGDAGLDSGRPQNIFTLDQTLIANGQLQKVDRVNLQPGDEAAIDGGIAVRFDGAAEYANYQISHDPSQGWVLASAIVMLAGLIGSLMIKRRRVWVRFVEEPAGVSGAGEAPAVSLRAGEERARTRTRTRIELGGLARTDRAGWTGEFDELTDVILGKVDPATDDSDVMGYDDL
ncbi:cytochrome c biogenesis protein ResB [Corynebacterium cystitidis]|uniref:cytochrome c biogenesis protein ResB n=1 Tax=Corynebacterium cystitidis TaxID=35757 RepID=UPI00211DEB8D|nr:cytochrome c biogenesis protein ResB [Corynebacterium cystitidis]